ncbi:MAG: serine hydrolase domain-containing protein [Pseudorhodobacter sp.]
MYRIRNILLFLAVIVLLLGLWKRTEIVRLLSVLTLFEPDRIVANFSAMDRSFSTVDLPVGNNPLPLPQGPPLAEVSGMEEFLKRRSVTALVVLKDGAIAKEHYLQGTTAEDRRISWSVAKSFLSALFGIVLAEGTIRSIDDPVTLYAPQLVGGAYDNVAIRDVLTMSSGIQFDEGYLDYNSDINRMGRSLAIGKSMDGFAAELRQRDRPAGTQWAYVSIDTHVLGMVLRGATGRDIAGLMSEKLLAPLGLEAAPSYITDGFGEPFVLGGLNLRARDYARFGLLFANDGALRGAQIVPRDWVRMSTRPQANTPPGAPGYGYQWWIPPNAPDGVFFARGIYGQFIYIDRPGNLVITINSADLDFATQEAFADYLGFFRQISASFR